MNPSVDAKSPCYHSSGEQNQQHRHGPKTCILLGKQDSAIGFLNLFLNTSIVPIEELAGEGAANDHAESRGQVAQTEGGLG